MNLQELLINYAIPIVITGVLSELLKRVFCKLFTKKKVFYENIKYILNRVIPFPVAVLVCIPFYYQIFNSFEFFQNVLICCAFSSWGYNLLKNQIKLIRSKRGQNEESF